MRNLLVYAAAGILCALTLVATFRLWASNPSVPMHYGNPGIKGDDMFHLALFKTVAETGWYTTNPRLGAPGRLDIHDFPYAETATFLVVRLLSLASTEAGFLANGSFLSAFLFETLASVYVMRRFGAGDSAAVALSLLFAFAPYHFFRGVWHPHLGEYACVPLATLAMLWLCEGEPIAFRAAGQWKPAPAWIPGRTLPCFLAVAALAISGPYYCYFGSCLILASALIALRRGPASARILDAGALLAAVAVLLAIQLAPFLLYKLREGPNPAVAARPVSDYYRYALTVRQLLVPNARMRGEADFATLGPVAAGGFLVLVVASFTGGYGTGQTRDRFTDLGRLAVAALLLATTGGFGELVAVNLSSQIRCYNRICIFLEFFGLLAVGLLLTPALGALAASTRRWARWLAPVGLVILLAFGLYHQLPIGSGILPNHADDAAAYRRDRDFFRRVEASVAPGSPVFQLPYSKFPEQGPILRMPDYDHFRGYIHSRRLRWSYGAMAGRDTDRWQRDVVAEPPARFVQRIREAGFGGVYINRAGMPDRGEPLVEALEKHLGERPLESEGGGFVFFPLAKARVAGAAHHAPSAESTIPLE